MSCCVGKTGNVRRKVRGVTAFCVNCKTSLSAQLIEEIKKVAATATAQGSYSVQAEIECECGYRNRVSTSFNKRT